jgi:hypothetical protein
LSLKEPFYVRKALEELEKGEEELCIKSSLFSMTVRRITEIFTSLDRFLTPAHLPCMGSWNEGTSAGPL